MWHMIYEDVKCGFIRSYVSRSEVTIVFQMLKDEGIGWENKDKRWEANDWNCNEWENKDKNEKLMGETVMNEKRIEMRS